MEDRSTAPLREALSEALAALPLIEREVYLLSARDGLALADVAQRLGISSGEAERALATAIVAIDRQLSGEAGRRAALPQAVRNPAVLGLASLAGASRVGV